MIGARSTLAASLGGLIEPLVAAARSGPVHDPLLPSVAHTAASLSGQGAAASADIGILAIIVVVATALIGLVRGGRREAVALLVAAGAALLLGAWWSGVAGGINASWGLMDSAVLQRGAAAAAEGSSAVAVDSPGPVPVTGDARLWQVGLFFFITLIFGYGGGRLLHEAPDGGSGAPRLSVALDRLVGALLGGLTGLVIGRFTLPRIVSAPDASFPAVGPESAIYDRLAPFAPIALLLAIVIFVLLGVSSISGGSPKQRMYE